MTACIWFETSLTPPPSDRLRGTTRLGGTCCRPSSPKTSSSPSIWLSCASSEAIFRASTSPVGDEVDAQLLARRHRRGPGTEDVELLDQRHDLGARTRASGWRSTAGRRASTAASNASVAHRHTSMCAWCPVMPSGPNVRIVSGCTSSTIDAHLRGAGLVEVGVHVDVDRPLEEPVLGHPEDLDATAAALPCGPLPSWRAATAPRPSSRPRPAWRSRRRPGCRLGSPSPSGRPSGRCHRRDAPRRRGSSPATPRRSSVPLPPCRTGVCRRATRIVPAAI